MTTLAVSVPDELMELLGSEEAAREHLTRTAVLDLVRHHIISQGRGAELLGKSLWDFQDLMAGEDVPVVDLIGAELADGCSNLHGV